VSNFVAVPGAAYARANYGRWVVECPQTRPFVCRDALQMHPGDPLFVCPTCDTRADIVWPQDVAMIEELLMARPDPATRNWEPGETTTWLLTENLAHGVEHAVSPELGAASSRLVLDASGAGPVSIRMLDEMLTIDAAVRPEIGA
jgi:hypothetical protein